MKNKNKSFDCVEMKRRIQESLFKEYERRKSEFSSYVDFINKTADKTPEIKEYRKGISNKKTTLHSNHT